MSCAGVRLCMSLAPKGATDHLMAWAFGCPEITLQRFNH